MSSIKKNFIYNLSITLAQYVAGLIVFPHVSRCLGVELMGKTSFATNVVAYFSLFALLGASVVGAREVAICRDDFRKRSAVYSSVMAVILVLSMISLVAMTVSVFLIPKFYDCRLLLLIGSFSLIFTSLQIEWLYQGIQKFEYIAKRSILVKAIYCISIFLFVKDQSDYLIYYSLTVFSVVLNGIINLLYSRRYVKFSLNEVQFKKFLKPICMFGVNKVLISMYTTVNVLYLGIVCNDVEVGYYSTANKLFAILLGVISAFTTVILPKMSSMAAEKNMNDFNALVSKSFSLILSVSIPICIGGIVLAQDIIQLLAGSGYEGAIIPMQIIMPVIVLTGAAQVCIMQVLIPLKKDKVVLYASAIGAASAMLLNFLFVGKLGATGSALVLLLSELFSGVFAFRYAVKQKVLVLPWSFIIKRCFSSIPYIIICYVFGHMLAINGFIALVLSILLCAIYYFIESLYILKLPLFQKFISNSNSNR